MYQDDILGDLKLTKYPTLFHLLYYDIFKYQSGLVTESLIETLKAEYNETKTNSEEKKSLIVAECGDMTADGFSLDDKRSPIADNDIPDIIERFRNLDKETDRKRTDKSFMVSKKEIAENDYDLSINKYKEIEYVAVEYPPTSEIMANIREIEKQISQEMDELEKLLSE